MTAMPVYMSDLIGAVGIAYSWPPPSKLTRRNEHRIMRAVYAGLAAEAMGDRYSTLEVSRWLGVKRSTLTIWLAEWSGIPHYTRDQLRRRWIVPGVQPVKEREP